MRFIRQEELTTILVTHSMEDAARYADNIIVMSDGTSVMTGTPEEVFGNEEKLASYRLGLPRSVQFQRDFEKIDWPYTFQALHLRKNNLLKSLQKQLWKKVAANVRKDDFWSVYSGRFICS